MQHDNSYRLLLSTRHLVLLSAPPGWNEVRQEPLIPPLHLAGWNLQFLKNSLRRFVFLNWRSAIQSSQKYYCLMNTVLTWQSRLQALKFKTTSRSCASLCTQVMLFNPWTEFSSHSRQSDVRFWKYVLANREWEEWTRRIFPSCVVKVMERI